jgi:hypothetical protein
MNQREVEKAIERELESWPGVTVEFVSGGKHPKAKYWFMGKMLARPYPGTPSDSVFGIHRCLGDVRRILKQLGAQRTAPEPSKEEDEAPYRKPNDGAEKRPHPVKGEAATVKPTVADQLAQQGVVEPEVAAAADAARVATQGAGSVETYVKAQALEQRVPSRFEQQAREIAARLDRDVTDDEIERLEARIAEVMDRAAAIVDGVYFALPEDVYHAVPRISASGLQRLCVSPATFWADSWLNPEKLIAEPDEGATPAQVLGKAYHCARLEPERFEVAYCRKPDKKLDYGGRGLLTSDTAVKAKLKEMGEQQTVTGESNVERALRLLDAGHDGPIWSLIEHEFEEERGDRIGLPAKYYDQIVADMEGIREQGEIAELMTGGAAEVSIFWTDRHGIKCKCRCDYLTAEWWTDLKTFANPNGKVLEQALADTVRYNRYHVQATHYRDGVEALRSEGLDIVGEATEAQRELVAKIRIRPDELACWFVFQEKGGVPNLLAREFPFYEVPLQTRLNNAGATEEQKAEAEAATRRRSGLFARGTMDVLHAKDQFVLYSNAYDAGTPWFPLNARQRFSDLEFNQYWLEGKA